MADEYTWMPVGYAGAVVGDKPRGTNSKWAKWAKKEDSTDEQSKEEKKDGSRKGLIDIRV
ncbi:hypothetical protein [Candidatus Magnetominusculus xianensis]|uniref:Uncharacterized protein n=1 Tax=Candidatus Magnetominusculus xianensis TaxID=1748249 RepID=A0ABR5SHP8_9BACT|nr:hypothetical protein [Candidatus Magnetominusculus xianensis]KWT86073.1 hypothetical protein ASN18_1560 [Candidatus Magnetominusculus xianensis]MBF0404402.1 hypothetical protein [Nitrospirota bacterium]